ncbi:MAG: DHH family phosphoesterase [Oscillospiraceae bacterium]|nr:DHH family phosphoesterase [Oscillospiraceae bacterium]
MKKRLSWVLAVALLLLGITSLALCVVLFADGRTAMCVAAGMVLLCALIMFVVILVMNKDIAKYVTKMDKSVEAINREAFYDFPVPIIITDDEDRIIWYNKRFEEKFFDDDRAYGLPLTNLVGNNLAKVYSQNGACVRIFDRYYNVYAKKSDTSPLSIIRLTDVTDRVLLEEEYNAQKKTVLIMTVDNYDDAFQNSKESDKASVQAQIEQIFERFIEHTNGVLHKISNDRFFAVIEERHLTQIIDGKFDILDEIRSIQLGGRPCVTLSIGVGRGAKTLAESEVYAKQALDMCLGRGGDQAAVKTDSGFEFFGGISKAVEKSNRVRSRIIATALRELADSCGTVYLMGHNLADFDAVGSCIGLCGAFRSVGKEAYVVVDPEKNLAKKLIEYITASGEGDYFKSCEQAVNEITPESLLIICDTHNPNFLDSKELYEKAKTVVVIDHHRKMVNFIDNSVIFFHEPFASSACEMATELVQYFGVDCRISVADAEALLSGINLDTKNFVMRAGTRTFEAAAYLKKLGADTVTVKGFFSDSLETYRERSKLIQSAELFHGCAIATTDSEKPELILAAAQAADELLGINGVKASFVVYHLDGQSRVSARSLGSFNVQLIMESVGGGGHQTMAGAQLNLSVEETVDKIKSAIEDFIIA